MNLPTLSVLMPNYNYGHYIAEAIEAILSQSHQPVEMLVLDDASSDGSVEVIQSLQAGNPRLQLIRNERNRGVTWGMKHLLARAQGEYVYFAASDDKVLPGFIENTLALLARYPAAGLCTTRSRIMDAAGQDQGVLPALQLSSRPTYVPPDGVRPLLMRFGSWMQGNTAVYRKEALIQAGGFLPELRAFTDGFISQVLALRHGVCFVPDALAAWRRMNTTYSSRLSEDVDAQREIISIAARLMQREYAGDFPPKYAARWQNETRFNWARRMLSRSRQVQRLQISTLSKLEHAPSGLMRALTAALGAGADAQYLWALVWLCAAYRPRHAAATRVHNALQEHIGVSPMVSLLP